MEVENTYEGDQFLVTVADYDGDFANDPAYDDYGVVYRNIPQVKHVVRHSALE